MRAASGSPEQPGEGEAEGGKEGEEGRQAEDAEGHRPGELVGLDEEGGAEPPQAGDEIAEAPEPAVEGSPICKARGGRGARRRRRGARPPARGAATRAGRKPKGGMARAPTAPAAVAASRRRHPFTGMPRSDRRVIRRRRFPAAEACGGGRRAPGGGAAPRRWMRSRLTPPRIGIENLEFEAVRPGDQLAAGRHAAGERDDEAAEGIDILGAFLLGEVDAEGSP